MHIGYAFNGYLSDLKLDENGVIASTPDGNATYSWAIIRELQRNFNKVYRLMPNLDKYAEENDQMLFTFAAEERKKMMKKLRNVDVFNENLPKLDLVILEWRWPIPGKNTSNDINKEGYSLDLKIQELILNMYKGKVIVLDLDYKMSVQDILDERILAVFELGYKNTDMKKVHHVEIPFDFREMKLDFVENPITDLIYIGNRYERDNSVDEWLNPLAKIGYKVSCFGNWKEKGRDSEKRWPDICFGNRLQVKDFHIAYENSRCTILLAKDEYYKYGFMTARILESILFGCIPIGLRKHKRIEKYLPDNLIVEDVSEVIEIINMAKDNKWRERQIRSLRQRLSFMDSKFFYNKLKIFM